MARTRWPPGSVNPGLLHRTGRSDRHRRWVPKEPGPRPADRFAGQPAGVSRFAGQAGTQARPYASAIPKHRKQGRTHYLHPPCRLRSTAITKIAQCSGAQII